MLHWIKVVETRSVSSRNPRTMKVDYALIRQVSMDVRVNRRLNFNM